MHPLDQPSLVIRVRLPPKHFQAAGDDHEEVVEIVGDAAGKLPNRFHLLGLGERLLRFDQLGGALFHPFFEVFIELSQRGLGALAAADVAHEHLQPAVGQHTCAHFNVYRLPVFKNESPFGAFSAAADLHSQAFQLCPIGRIDQIAD